MEECALKRDDAQTVELNGGNIVENPWEMLSLNHGLDVRIIFSTRAYIYR